MRRAMVLVVLAGTVGATPKRAEVMKKFPVVTLPFTGNEKVSNPVALSPKEIEALGFLTFAGTPKELAEWRPTSATNDPTSLETTHQLVGIGQAKIGDVTVLLVHHVTSFPAGTNFTVTALAYDKETLTGAAEVNPQFVAEIGEQRCGCTLAVDGTITRNVKLAMPMMIAGLPETMTPERSEEQRFDGQTWGPTSSRATNTGIFRDPKSKEELFVFANEIYYRGNEQKPVQRLAYDGKAVRFGTSKTAYVLQWDDAKRTITCTDPKGKAQTFVREW